MPNQEIMISGARSCSGSIKISGAKNASLPLMAASLLTNQTVTLENVPQISDIDVMIKQLQSYGVQVTKNGSTLRVHASNAATRFSPASSDGSNTRGSFFVLGPLLARFKAAKVYLPGGCQIGRNGRPVDYHIKALQDMGATLEQGCDYVLLRADQGLRGAQIHFPKVSVGATETVIMAACLAEGQTVITNAAVEPEVLDLIDMLGEMGMQGIEVHHRQNKIVINGNRGRLLNGCTHTVIPDRIEAGTWAIAAAITGGSLTLEMEPEIGQKIMVPVLEMLQRAGVSLQWRRNGLHVQRLGAIQPVDIITGPFPRFPTDLLPQWVTFMIFSTGSSTIEDTIYDNRFSHVPELKKMGASFTPDRLLPDSKYHVKGLGDVRLRGGTRVRATDLRAGAALILAALKAEGPTKVENFHHVLRGYENIKEKLRSCWGVSFDSLPQTRQGFHGGSRTEVRQSHHRR